MAVCVCSSSHVFSQNQPLMDDIMTLRTTLQEGPEAEEHVPAAGPWGLCFDPLVMAGKQHCLDHDSIHLFPPGLFCLFSLQGLPSSFKVRRKGVFRWH